LVLPDYTGGGIVNLMSSICAALGAPENGYPQANLLTDTRLGSARNILLLVIDGLGYEYLRTRGDGSVLSRYMRGKLTSVCPSTTASAIPTFLTGVAPQQHGFTGWFTYFKELADVLAVLPFRPRHGGESLASAGFSPTGLCGAQPLFSRLDVESTAIMPAWIADSDFNRAFNGPAASRPYSDLKGFFKAIKASIKRNSKRHYIYAYWPQFDSLAHAYGVGSEQVYQHFQQLETGLAQLLRALAGSDTALILTADHGFIDTTEERTIYLHDHPELQQTLLLPLCGEPRLTFCYVHPHAEERFKDYIETELSHGMTLLPSSQLLDEGWFGAGERFSALSDRIGHYTLVMKENYKIKDWIMGERQYIHLGVHGGVSSAEMYVPLVYCEL
jgi:hypothetical protein